METVATHRGEGPSGHSSSDDDTILEVQFDDLEQQHEASTIGMGLFLMDSRRRHCLRSQKRFVLLHRRGILPI